MNDRRYGVPRTNEERQQMHYDQYGEWLPLDQLPPRGTGLISQAPSPSEVIGPIAAIISVGISIAIYKLLKKR